MKFMTIFKNEHTIFVEGDLLVVPALFDLEYFGDVVIGSDVGFLPLHLPQRLVALMLQTPNVLNQVQLGFR